MASDKLEKFVHNAMCASGDDEVDCLVARRAVADALRSPEGIAALAADETIRAGILRGSIREYWENTDGAGRTVHE